MTARKSGMATGVEVARINVKVLPDTKEFRRALKSELEQIERTMKGDVHIKAHLDSAQARADFERLKRSMDKGRNVKIGVDLAVGDGKNGKGLDLPGENEKSSSKRKFKLPDMPSFGSGINASGWAVILAGVTAVAAPLFGLISTAMAAMPGLLATLIAPIASVTMGMDGIRKAAEAAGLTSVKTGKNGKKKSTLGETLKELQADTNKAFEEGLTPAFQKIGTVLAQPVFQSGFTGIASGLSQMVQGFADAVSSSRGMEHISNSVKQIGEGLGRMRPGIEGFTDGIAQLVEQFTQKMPDIADWFNKSGKGFSDWVKQISADGTLSTAFDQLGHTIDVVLSKVADWGRAAINFMGTPDSMNGFIETLGNIGDLISGLIELSSRFNQAWQGVVQAGRIAGAAWSIGTLGISDLLQGNMPFSGAASNLGDFFSNKPWMENASQTQFMGGAKEQVVDLSKALDNAQFKAQQTQSSLSELLGTGAPAKIQGPGFNNDYPAAGAGAAAAAKASGGNKIPAPDTTEAKAALQDYQTSVEKTMTETKTSIQQVSSNIPPPDLSQFKSSFEGVAEDARTAVDQAAAAFDSLGEKAGAAAQSAADQIRTPFSQLAESIQQVGVDIDNGLAAGIADGASAPINAAAKVAGDALQAAKNALGIKSPSRKFMEIGNFSAQGLGKGLEEGIGPVIDQAKDLAGKVAGAFATDGDPTGFLDGFSNQEVGRMEKVLAFESKRIGLQAKALDYQAKTTGNNALKAKADELRLQKEQIDSQKEMLGLTKEYADLNGGSGSFSGSDNPFLRSIQELMKMPNQFLGATSQQAMSDLGISGNGALEAIGNYATGMASNFIFNVSNVDEAFSLQQRQVTKQSMGLVGR